MGRAPSSPILLKRKKRRRRSNVWGRFVFVFFWAATQVVQGQEETRRRGDIYSSLSRFVGGAPTQNVARRLGQTRSPDLSSFNLALSLLSLFPFLSVFEFQTETEKILWRVEGNSFGAPLLFSCTSCFPGDRRAASHNQSAPVLFVFFSSSLGDCEGR